MFKKTILPNKLRIITASMKETQAVTLYLVIRVGSRYEEKEQSGISHFLEHLFFKGTEKRPTTLEIAKELDSVGALYNAFTSEEMTGFYISAERKQFSLILDVLFDILENSLFAEEEINQERKVILEEINLRKDTPMVYVLDLYKQLLYGDTPLGRMVIGSPKTILNLKRDDFLRFKDRFYTPSQIVLAVAGNIKEKDLALINEYFKKLKPGPSYQPCLISEAQTAPKVNVYYKKTDQSHLALGFKSICRSSPLRYAQEVLNIILGASMSSRLFIQLREKRGLCYYVSSDTWYFQETGTLLVSAGVPIKRTEEAIEIVLEEFKKLKKEGPSDSEVKRAKDYLKGRMALKMESSFNRASFLADQELLLGEIKTPKQELKEIEKVKVADIMKLIKEIVTPQRVNLALIGPFKEKETFEKILNSKI